MRKLKDVRVFKFQYLTKDSLSEYCSPFVDSQVIRIVSPRDFQSHMENSRAVYWFEEAWDCMNTASDDFITCKHHLFADYVNWSYKSMCGTRKCTTVGFPCKTLAERATTLTSCLNNPIPIYPGSYQRLAPLRVDLIDRKRMAICLSMGGIKRLENKLAIMSEIEKTLTSRDDVFITLLTDGQNFKEEREYAERFGNQYSDRCLLIDSFSNYEYMNILKNQDMFIDLNPINSVGYFLSAALHSGLLVGGFTQPLYRDILDDGNYGFLINGERREFGYGWDHVLPNWSKTFKIFNENVFNVNNFLARTNRRNSLPNFQSTLEQRTKAFLGLFLYLTNTAVKVGECVVV